jgi:ubiquinone/menaquinone biosynthesis C-methylase UbiE
VQVTSAKLPFEDESFDVVISHHVIEHMQDQSLHLMEINRVLKPGGACYFATPNRNFLLEPHYRIPFIHYLPDKLFHSILKMLGRYQEELHLLTYGNLINLFMMCHFDYKEYTSDVLKNPEKYNLDSKYEIFSHIPLWLLNLFIRFTPGNIFVITPDKSYQKLQRSHI